MFCPECGTKLTDDAIFCPECGERIAKQDSIIPPSYQPSESSEEKIKIEYSIDIKNVNLIFVWVSRLVTILSNLSLAFLAFDFDKVRREHIGLMFLAKEERLQQYFELGFEFGFSQWTILFFVCFIISCVMLFVLTLYAQKHGVCLDKEEKQQDKHIYYLIELFSVFIFLAAWVWILI